jgi:hypothetical protein
MKRIYANHGPENASHRAKEPPRRGAVVLMAKDPHPEIISAPCLL